MSAVKTQQSEPYLLAIDTAVRCGRVGSAQGLVLINAVDLDSERGHARDLTRAIRDVLKTHAKSITDVAAIAVNIGPGSLTGIRVALATAKAIAFAANVRLIGVDAFDLIAESFRGMNSRFRAVVGFQLNTMLCVEFTPQGDRRWQRGPLRVVPAQELGAIAKEGVPFAGPGLQRLLRVDDSTPRLEEPHEKARLSELAAIATSRYHSGQVDDPYAIEPFYARASSAEVMWDARRGSGSSERFA